MSAPTPESLNLSASLFTSTISSWIPSNFGHVVPHAEAEKEWQAILRSAGEGKDRLGLGHPLIDAPKASKGLNGAYGRGMQGLEKSLKRQQKRNESDEKEERQKIQEAKVDEDEEEEEEEEEESRAKLIGKRKRPAKFDPLAIKKGKKATEPTSRLSDNTVSETAAQGTSVGEITTPALPSGPIANAGASSDAPVRAASPSSPGIAKPNVFGGFGSSSSLPASPAKSKSALKRERKRRAKLARAT